MNFSDESNKNFTDFSALYEEQLQSVSLPAKLAGSFTLKNCLKHSGTGKYTFWQIKQGPCIS